MGKRGLLAASASRATRTRAQALAVMFVAGATSALLALVVPHGTGVDAVPYAINAALAYPVALVLLRAGPRLPDWAFHTILVTGGVMVTIGMTFGNGGPITIAAAFYYVWVPLYVFWFFDWPVAAGHVGANGAMLAMALAITDIQAGPAVWVMIMVTAMVVGGVISLLRRELSLLATTDQLTGLPNRHVVVDALERELARAHRTCSPLTVAVLDVDGLKQVNDRDGHPAGDALLIDAAVRWHTLLRSGDLLARMGGDEFVAVLPACDLTDAEQIVTRLIRSGVSCSAGLATWTPGETQSELLARADARLYDAKRQGGGRAVVAPA